jgi:EAL domain-containing protein (putative c-di-GMP-specific phosphodiesterase class I)
VHDIETSLQVADAIYAGVDYLQGNYLSKPAQALHTISPQLINETLLMNEIAYPDSGIMRKI